MISAKAFKICCEGFDGRQSRFSSFPASEDTLWHVLRAGNINAFAIALHVWCGFLDAFLTDVLFVIRVFVLLLKSYGMQKKKQNKKKVALSIPISTAYSFSIAIK